MSKKRYRAGIIGCGQVAFANANYDRGQQWWLTPSWPLSHIEAFRGLPDVEVVAVCDLNQDLARAKAAEFQVPAVYTNFVEMITRENLDVVSVATPIRSHFAVMRTLAETPVRGVYLEKPITYSVGEARELIALYDRVGKPVGVNLFRSSDIAHQRALKLVRDGAIGDVRAVFASWERAGLQECGTHAIDICNLFAGGAAKRVFGRLDPRKAPNDDVGAHLLIEYDNGVTGQVWVPTADTAHVDEVKVVGTKGNLRLGKYVAELCVYENYGGGKDTAEVLPVIRPLPTRAHGLSPTQRGIRAVLDAIETGVPVRPGLRQGLAALELVVGAYQSADTGTWASLPIEGAYSSFGIG